MGHFGSRLRPISSVRLEEQLPLPTRKAGDVLLEANSDATLLVLSREPLSEPIVGSGPFVMNSEKEITDAFDDFNSGRFGRIPPVTD